MFSSTGLQARSTTFPSLRDVAVNQAERTARIASINCSDKASLAAAKSQNVVLLNCNFSVVTACSDGFCRLSGFTQDEVLGRDLDHLILSPDEQDATKSLLQASVLTQQGFEISAMLCHTKGTCRLSLLS